MPVNRISVSPIADERNADLQAAKATAATLFHAWLVFAVIGLLAYRRYCRWYHREQAKRAASFRDEWQRHDQQQRQVRAGLK